MSELELRIGALCFLVTVFTVLWVGRQFMGIYEDTLAAEKREKEKRDWEELCRER